MRVAATEWGATKERGREALNFFPVESSPKARPSLSTA